MSLEVRPVQPAELVSFIDALSTGFLDRPNVQAVADEVGQHWDLSRTWAAFDDDRICGTFRTWAGRLTVPGCHEIPASAVSGVTVLPTHRRRGVLSRMVRAGHQGARERGEVVSMLFASEYPIYGRFGYGPATTWTSWTLRPRQTSFVPAAPDSGRMSLVAADDAALEICRGIYEAVRVRQPGEIWRRPITWKDDFGLSADVWGSKWKGFVALHLDAAGTPDGFVRYHTEDKWDDRQPANKLFVDDLHALTDEVQLALWRYVASIDWVASVRAERRSPEERLPWLLTNLRATTPDDIGDGLWVKLLDVPAALQARRYERTGSIVLELVDGDGADADDVRIEERIRVVLDASPEGATATPSERSPDLTISSGALGAAFLGGTRLARAVLQRGFDEHRPGALDLADSLLRTREAPWCSSFF
ncbi:MAG TPA: GNAT family N-acetyltransferase [Candidatus Limnocylindrales bacterium]|jgi:predicted acetyltransferase